MIATASLLLFVLSGAYLFLYQCHYTAYLAARTEGRQLLFQVGAVAALFIILSRVLLLLGELFVPTPIAAFAKGLWSAVFATFEVADLPVYVVAFVLGPALAQLINLFYGRERASTDTIRRYGTETEKLLVRAMEDQDLILVTLDSRKVYVGWTIYSPEPRIEGKDFRLLPVMSGYRDEQGLFVEFTTQYATAYERVEAGEVEGLQVDDFETMIPLESVISVGLFSLYVNPAWFNMENLAEGENKEEETS
jgi:hypothetical protein